MKTDAYIWWVLGVIVSTVLGAWLIAPLVKERFHEDRAVVQSNQTLNTYTNEAVGLSISYPLEYVFVEDENTDASFALSFSLVLGDEYREFLASSEARKGPPSITIEVFLNPNQLTSRGWVRESPRSNFRFGTGLFTTTHIDGEDAIRYRWEGLYEAESAVVVLGGYTYVFTMTFLDESRLETFYDLLRSVELVTVSPEM